MTEKIRWEVIADFPAALYNVGDIITTNKSLNAYVIELHDSSDSITHDVDLSDYPHLFKRLKTEENEG